MKTELCKITLDSGESVVIYYDSETKKAVDNTGYVYDLPYSKTTLEDVYSELCAMYNYDNGGWNFEDLYS